MSVNKIIVFKGKGSWTGDATEKRYPKLEYETGASFDSILELLKTEDALAILPLWNSHSGEITDSKVVESIFESGLRIHAIWPHWIDFSCIVRKGATIVDIKKVISIGVAEKQCSEFLIKYGIKFYTANSTVDAHKVFSEGKKYDAVLCNPELCNKDTQEILIPSVANKLNFTTFVLLGSRNSAEWSGDHLAVVRDNALPKSCQVSCIEMPAITGPLSEEQHEIFAVLSENAENINAIPKVIFVGKRGYSKIGLILENKGIYSMGAYSEPGFSSEIKIINDVGTIKSLYTEEINSFIPGRYSSFSSNDFLKHSGSGSCFFSCPRLNILVHGFETDIVEIFVRESIVKHFDAIDKGVVCDAAQRQLFKKYRNAYYEKGVEFVEFVDLS